MCAPPSVGRHNTADYAFDRLFRFYPWLTDPPPACPNCDQPLPMLQVIFEPVYIEVQPAMNLDYDEDDE